MTGTTGTEQEKLAIIEGILEKAAVACQGACDSPQSALVAELVVGLRGAMRSCSLSEVYDLSPISASVTDDGTFSLIWDMGDAKVRVLVGPSPYGSRIVFADGSGAWPQPVPFGPLDASGMASEMVDFVTSYGRPMATTIA